MNEAPLGLLFGALAILIVLSGFFSSSETGMMSLNRYRLKHLKKTKRGAKQAAELLERPERLIGLILIGNNLVNILASAIATVIAIRLFGNAGIAVATVSLTLVILIFAEVTPKTMAALFPEKVAFPASYILKPLMVIFSPLVWTINQISNALLKIARIDTTLNNNDQITSDELRVIVNEASSHIPERHQGMLINILDLEKMSVNDIVIPRKEVYGININDDAKTILKQIRNSEFTRILVYRGDTDNVIGILHLRNANRLINKDGSLDKKRLLDLMLKPYFVPEGTSLHVQLLNFQKEKRRIGIVVDEYGDLQGVVTLEDILEEIVGEFTSNLADEAKDIRRISDDTYIINGSANIREINRNQHWSLPIEGPKTLSGLILEHLESFPDANACIQLDGYIVEILNLKENKIQSARVQKIDQTS